jgi:hypothetical protein
MPEHRTQANLMQVYESAEIYLPQERGCNDKQCIHSYTEGVHKVVRSSIRFSISSRVNGMTATTRLDDDARLGSLAQDSFLIFSN